MSENAELWSRLGEYNERITITNWLEHHKILYNENQSTSELIELYRHIETTIDKERYYK